MGICTSQYYSFPYVPRRIRLADCTAFADLNRWVNFMLGLNLTPSPQDNDPASGFGAWSVSDLPVTHATQDVDDRGDDLLLVGMGNRIYVLDWTQYHDRFGWDTKTPIYRRMQIGPIPSNATSATEQAPAYDPFAVKIFRRFTFELQDVPATLDPIYRVSVEEDGRPNTRRVGVRTVQKRADAKVACRGLAFVVTLEHQADEDFGMTWWRAEWDVKGPRIRPNAHVPI